MHVQDKCVTQARIGAIQAPVDDQVPSVRHRGGSKPAPWAGAILRAPGLCCELVPALHTQHPGPTMFPGEILLQALKAPNPKGANFRQS